MTDANLGVERKRVTRIFQRYTAEERANRAASHRRGYQQCRAVGFFFYVHPDLPNVVFDTRGAAARAAIASRNEVLP